MKAEIIETATSKCVLTALYMKVASVLLIWAGGIRLEAGNCYVILIIYVVTTTGLAASSPLDGWL